MPENTKGQILSLLPNVAAINCAGYRARMILEVSMEGQKRQSQQEYATVHSSRARTHIHTHPGYMRSKEKGNFLKPPRSRCEQQLLGEASLRALAA